MLQQRSRKKTIIQHAIALKNENAANEKSDLFDFSKENKDEVNINVISPISTPKSKKSDVKTLIPKKLIEDLEEDPNTDKKEVGVVTPQKKSPFGGKFHPSTLLIDPRVKKIYKLINKSTGSLGGNGYAGAIYGELTMHSMQRVTNLLIEKCGMNHASRFIDVGSGLGKPNFHVAQHPAVRLSLGVELETIRWQLAMHNLFHVLPAMGNGLRPPDAPIDDKNGKKSTDKLTLHSNVNFICSDIDAAKSTDPFTHIYMYDLGFPPPLQQSIAKKFNNSVHAKFLISYRPPHRVIFEYEYDVELVDQVPTSMHGSGEVHTCYFYRRTNTPRRATDADNKISIPARPHFEETDIEVVCDPCFAAAVTLAIGDVSILKEHVDEIAKKHMESSRPKRERKPRVLV